MRWSPGWTLATEQQGPLLSTTNHATSWPFESMVPHDQCIRLAILQCVGTRALSKAPGIYLSNAVLMLGELFMIIMPDEKAVSRAHSVLVLQTPTSVSTSYD